MIVANKMKQIPSVGAVIPSFNCKKNLFRLIKSLNESGYKNLKIFVVDNGSKDQTLTEGKRKFKDVIWIDAGQLNIGQTGCYNIGFANSKINDFTLYVDSDVVVEPGMIQELIKRANVNRKVGIVTPMILYLNNNNLVNQAGAEVNLNTGRVKVGWGPKDQYLNSMVVQNSGTAMIIKKEVIKKIGAFEDWFLCYFDSDYCLRANNVGFETWYEPKAICYHDQSSDPHIWRPRVIQRAYLLGRNRVLFMRRHGKNILLFILYLFPLLGYYFYESIKFNQMDKFIKLLFGTIVGFFYPLKKGNYIPLPKI